MQKHEWVVVCWSEISVAGELLALCCSHAVSMTKHGSALCDIHTLPDTQAFRQQQPASQPTGDPGIFAAPRAPAQATTFQSPATAARPMSEARAGGRRASAVRASGRDID